MRKAFLFPSMYTRGNEKWPPEVTGCFIFEKAFFIGLIGFSFEIKTLTHRKLKAEREKIKENQFQSKKRKLGEKKAFWRKCLEQSVSNGSK